jgi:hypothetical protein
MTSRVMTSATLHACDFTNSGCERLSSDQQREPAGPAPLGICFGAPYQVALADDSD